MKVIYKYPISQIFDVDLPEEAEVLTVQIQYGKPVMWVLLDTKAPTRKRSFILVGTGHIVKNTLDLNSYIGSFQMSGGRLVLHLFENKS